MPARMASIGERIDHLPAVDQDPAALHRIGAEDGTGELGAPGADQAGQAQDLALADFQADVVEHDGVRVAGVAAAVDALDGQGHRTGARALAMGEQAIDLAADHQPDDALDVELGDRGLAGQRTVAQHGGVVADLQHLLEPVGDEDDRDALGLQPAHDREQALDLLVGQGRGRLVHDHELGRSVDRARAISTICCSATERSETRRRGSTPRPTSCGQGFGAPMQGRPVDPAQLNRQPADEHVLGHRERRDQVEFLVDRDDAQLLGHDAGWSGAPAHRRT